MSDPTTSTPSAPRAGRPWIAWLLFALCLLATLSLGLLLASVLERRQEARIQPPRVALDKFETDAAKWGVNWPREYASYQGMAQSDTMTKHGGSFPRDLLAETPANVVLFAGYAFAKEYRQARGHVYAVEDVTQTKRRNEKTPATCWSCKSPDVPRMMAKLGASKVAHPETATLQELALAGAGDFYKGKFTDFVSDITHPIGCLDCHEPDTMRLRVSRPGLIEAF